MKNIASSCSSWFSTNQLVNISGQKLILPFYHVVSDVEKLHYKHLYPAKTVEEFKQDLDFLINDYRAISLKELIEIVQSGENPKEKVFHLTFDDGLRELYDVIAPILKEKNIPATFFINTDFVDNKELFYRFKASLLAEEFGAKGLLDLTYKESGDIDEFAKTMNYNFDQYLVSEKPYLSSNQIQELINGGFTIGGHSLNHPLYNAISEEEQIHQTLESVNYLVDKFKLDYKVFSFPFTDNGVEKSFYNKINNELDLAFGTAGIKRDIAVKNLQRIPMEQNKSASEIIKSQYLYYIFKKLAGKNKIKR